VDLQNQSGEGYSEASEETLENALSDYEDTAEVTSEGKYRCRDCGLLFDTLEAHDRHYLEVHRREAIYPLAGIAHVVC
jgi:hypothetical protein